MFFEILVPCLLFISLVNTLSRHPILVVVSYDAFRYDFLDEGATPNMLRLRQRGTYADYVRNVFPTKTFPNHHSIATGFYPERHGVVGNTFYDPVTKTVVNMSYEMYHYDDTIEPIWLINEKAGDGRHSGSMMWPGGSFPYQDRYPSHYSLFQPSMAWNSRIDIALSWIEDPEKPANLVMIYFEEPDTHGHAFGPESKTVLQLVQQLDNVTAYLEQQLKAKGLSDKVNVIHLSDHGMTTVTPPHFINITQYLIPDTYTMAGSTPGLHVIPDEGFEEDVYRALNNASESNGHFTVYKKGDLPDRWRFKNNPRTPPIFVLADFGYGFQDLAENAVRYAEKYKFKLTNASTFGVHGYDNEMEAMRPFFLAYGPQIRVNHVVRPFDTVDLLSLFCEILRISPAPPNEGRFSNVQDVLVGYHGGILPIIVIIAGGTLLALLLILCAAAVTVIIIKRQQNITTAAALNKRFPQNNFSHSNIEAQHLLEPEDA